ncbi:MAG: NrsF family protein [Alphaproteobacteria bacterium]
MNKVPTDKLIECLAGEGNPVRRLPPPYVRTAIWLALSLPWVAAVVFIMGLRPDIGERLADGRWLVEQGAALATAITAAMAAFCVGVPGRPRWEHFVPFLPLAVWLGVLGAGCIETWLSPGGAGLILRPDWECLPGIVVVGLIPAAVMAIMILRGSPIAPTITTAFGALAAGGLAQVGLRLFHQEDASLMVLVWQTGTVFAIVLIAGLLGPKFLRWRLSPAR